jgi:3-dehydroquinate dehydratase/shikimate dehydrogenase
LPQGAAFVKLHMPIPDLPLFFSLVRKFPFHGFSVAVPLKEQLVRILTKIDPHAQAIGSVNTIQILGEHLIGANTDGQAAIDVLEQRKSVKGRRIALLGAGGSARAIAFEAKHRGAQVIALNRTLERAEQLARDFDCEAGAIEAFSQIDYDILINTVPVSLIFDPGSIHADATVMDITFWESETSLLEAAKERGCPVIHGIEVFERSAALQQDIWLNS